MPWELGFFDGLNGKVGVIPVSSSHEDSFEGEEYVSLYPYIDLAKAKGSKSMNLWINTSATIYGLLDEWIEQGNSAIGEHP
jgi:hypothetical protein